MWMFGLTGKKLQTANFLVLSMILIALAYLVPQMIGLGAGGFDVREVFDQFNFYQVAIGYFIIIALGFFLELIVEKGDSEYGDSVAFASPGETPSLSIFKNVTQFQLFLISLILASILGIFSVVFKMETFTGVRVLEQQFTPVASLIFSSFLIPISENLGSAAVIVLSLVFFRIIARKVKMSGPNFQYTAILLIPILIGTYGVVNHLLRYSGQDFNLLVVFVFWFIGGLITLLSGSFIPFWIFHLMNNLIFDTKRLFSADNILFGVIGAVIILIIIYFLIYGFRRKKRSGGE